jgi:hypothetical protein
MEKLRFKFLVDLIPKMRNMDINDIRRGIKVVVPDLLRDHGSGNDLAWVSYEEFKKGIFFGGKFNLDFFPKNPMPIGF